MQKLKYTVYDAFTNFYRRRSVNIIVVFSFALGLLLPILCLGNINVFIENLSTMRFRNETNVWIAYFEGGSLSAEDMSLLLQEESLHIGDYAISAYRRGTIEVNDTTNDDFVSYLTKGWDKFEDCKMIDGTLDMFSHANMCLVEQAFSDKYGGLQVGEQIEIFGVAYTIGGIFSSFNYYEKILLPIPFSEMTTESGITVSKLYLRTKEALPEKKLLTDTLKRLDMPVTSVKSGYEIYRTGLLTGLFQSIGIFGIGFAAFVFAAINISLVLVGRFNLDKRTYGIRMALGAPYRFVFLSAVIENMLCFGGAYLLDVVLIRILEPTYPEELTIILDAKVYTAAFLFGACMTIAVTWIALYKLKKKKLVELFERES